MADPLSKNVMVKNAIAVGGEKLSAPICVTHTDFEVGKRELHYFWGSMTAIQIYCVCFAALMTRQLWILHGITIILLREMAEKLFLWRVCFAESEDFRSTKRVISWLITFGLTEAEKVLQGGTFRIAVAGSAFHACKSIGPFYLYHLIRYQQCQINNLIVSETRDMIEQIERLRRKSSLAPD
jgi:hypothetical protein